MDDRANLLDGLLEAYCHDDVVPLYDECGSSPTPSNHLTGSDVTLVPIVISDRDSDRERDHFHASSRWSGKCKCKLPAD